MIKGTRSKKLKNFINDVFNYYGIHESCVDIHFEHSHPFVKDAYGYCSYDGEIALIDIYRYYYGHKNSIEDVLKSIIHEITHAKQYLDGELDYGNKSCEMVWKDRTYDVRQIKTEEQPWEQEAYAAEDLLYTTFKDSYVLVPM